MGIDGEPEDLNRTRSQWPAGMRLMHMYYTLDPPGWYKRHSFLWVLT